MRAKILLALFFSAMCILIPARELRAQEKIKESALRQIQALVDEKASRTPAQQKLDSRFVYMLRKQRNDEVLRSINLPLNEIKKNANGRFDVDITADVTPDLIRAIQATGTEITFQSAKFHSITATLRMEDLEPIAGRADVKFVEPHGEAQHAGERITGDPAGAVNYHPAVSTAGFAPFVNKEEKKEFRPDFKTRAENVRRQLTEALEKMKKNGFKKPFVGSRQSEGDITHRAVDARNAFNIDGTGLKIGVLSDECSAAALAASQASGDLGPVTILPGQQGPNSGQDEGTAMLEIIHDLAPGAQLYFATAFTSQASFAQNILDLRTAGCDIIVDDVFYYAESVFQDDNVARSVNTVTSGGALYFSSAGNQGNKNDGTASVWEGDFNDAGTATVGTTTLSGGTVHSFGATNYVTTLAANTAARVYLFWANPNGGAADDYDLYILNPGLTAVYASSTNVQSGTQNPIEVLAGNVPLGYQIVILKKTGAAAVGLHLNLFGTPISPSTNGQTHGHSSAANAFSVAATPANTRFNTGYPVGPYPGVFNTSNTVELFSSDGPRRVFFNPDGSPITPGNLTFGANGGTLRQKPDITAADGVQVTGNGGFPVPFYGTSAAAPHAGAIAALIMQAKTGITPAQVRTALVSTALDIETPGVDRDAGAGIVMAYQAVVSTSPTPIANIFLGTTTYTEGAVNNGNGQVDPGEVGKLVVQLNNAGTGNATAVSAVLTTAAPGVTITQGTASYGTINGSSSGSNTATPFVFGLDRSLSCGAPITFNLTVSYSGGPLTPKTFTILFTPGLHTVTIVSSNIAGAATTGTEFTSASGAQVGRINRDGTVSICGSTKTIGLFANTGNRSYHAYKFTNTTSTTQCIKVNTLVSNTSLFTVAYNNNGYVPATPNLNYAGDFGVSSSTGSPFNFNVPAGQSFTVVVHEVDPTAGAGTGYTLKVDIASCNTAPTCSSTTIAPATLPNGLQGSPYSQTITASGGSGVFTYALTAGALPPGMTFTGNTLAGASTASGTFNFSITATDVTGCPPVTQAYTLVIDPSPCVITCPANITTSNDANQCGAIVTYAAPTTSGNCGTITATPASGSLFPVGTTTVNVTSSTGGGCSFTVTVNDTQAPTITCPANITKSNDANQCGAVVTFPTITATDNCPGVTVTTSPTSGSFFPVGTTTVTVTATDAHGNTSNCTFTVTVNDTQAPVITCPSNITTASTTGTCGKAVTFTPTATDNCGGAVTITTSIASGSTFPVGTTTVTVTAKDAANNTSNCSFTVTVTDSQKPVISAQPASTISCEGGNASFSVTATNAVSYQWQVNSGSGFVNISGATSATLTLNNLTSGMNGNQYQVIVNGLCTPVTSNAATLTVRPAPQVGPITASPYSTLKPGQVTSLTTAFVGMPGSFTWYLGTNQVASGISPTISGLTVDDLGTYKVVFTDISNCQAQATFVLRAEPDFEFFVYPNPNNGQFQVRFYSYSLGVQRTVNVYDGKGARVFQKAFTMNSPYEKMDVDISRYSAGLYTVELRDAAGKKLGAAQIVVTH